MTSIRLLVRCVLVLSLSVAFDYCSASSDASSVVRSAPPSKREKATIKSRITPVATTVKSHVHQQHVELPTLSAGELESVRQEDAVGDQKRFRIGVMRELAQPVIVNAQTGSWTVLPDGSRVYTVKITAQGALGMRIHLENVKLDSRVRLIAYNPNSPEATVTDVSAPAADATPEIWTPTIFGEDAVIECQVPPDLDPAATSFSVTGISHRYRGVKATSADAAGACEHDVVCHPEWLDTAAGVASIDFVEKGTTFVCTGCLLNDSDPETTENYFLTAHHCVNSKTVAATLEAIWFYQAQVCDNPNSIDFGITTTGGADLLATSASSDFALLRLRHDPPGGVTYEGWTTGFYSDGDSTIAIHHPGGFEKKISFGNEVSNDRDFWNVQWNYGVTEPGSSGSPLFNADQQVTGQLFGGLSDCSVPDGQDQYGRFDITYAKIRKWIDNYAFLRLAGSYNGLFADLGNPTTESSGFLSLILRDQGAYSASLQIAGKKYSITGQFDESGMASNNISRAGLNTLTVQMTLNIAAGAESIGGTVTDGNWTADLLAKRAAFNAKTNPAPFASKYNVVLPGGNSTDVPNGSGFATINVDLNGKARIAGSLGDGTKLTQSVPIAADLTLPLFATPYSGKGVVNGWLAFNDSAPATDLSGSVSWIKDPVAMAKFYPVGFNVLVSAIGEIYTPPTAGTPILDFSSGTVSFAGGNLDGPFSNDVTLSSNSKITNESANKLSMSFVLSSGVFNGSVTPPSGGPALPFHGIVLRNSAAGYGYFLGSSESGSMTVQGQ